MVSPITSFYEWLSSLMLDVIVSLLKVLIPLVAIMGVYLLLEMQKTLGDDSTKSEKSGKEEQTQNADNSKTPLDKRPIKNQPRETDLLLIGKTGNGKSATGNSILWLLNHKPFKSSSSVNSITSAVSSEVTEYRGRKIRVVDGPGVGDTRKNGWKIVFEGLHNAIKINDKGYHAFLLVVKFGGRFTDEDKNAVLLLKNFFGGHAFLKNYCVLVITGGDNFERENQDSGKTFTEWCDEQKGVLTDIISECNNRVVLFDNLTKEETKKCEQLDELLKLVDSLPVQGHRYSDEQFELAKSFREKAIVNQRKPQINKAMLEETSLILQKINDIQTMDDPNQQLIPLCEQKTRLDALYEKIKSQDKETGALHDIMETVEGMRRTVYSQTEICRQMISDLARRNAEKQMRKEEKEEFEKRMKSEQENKILAAEEKYRKKLQKIQAEYEKCRSTFESKLAENSTNSDESGDDQSSGSCIIL